MTTTEWFECLDGIWHWNVWWYFKLKMQMILVCIPGYDRECRIFLAYLFKSKMKLFYHIRLQPLVSILRSPHYVVQVLVCAMLEALDSHRDWILDNSLSYYMSVVQYSSCTIPPRTLSAPRALSVIIPSLPAYGVSWCHNKKRPSRVVFLYYFKNLSITARYSRRDLISLKWSVPGFASSVSRFSKSASPA